MIEETLRYYPPFPATFRRTTRDVEVHGVTIPKDDRLLVLIASANHDERAFDRAEEFVIDRDPNRHLGFGQGIHYCLGAPLARLETQIVLNSLLPRIKSLRIEGDAGAVLVPGGPKELQVRFEFDHAFAMA
jgi:cytochrome P450